MQNHNHSRAAADISRELTSIFREMKDPAVSGMLSVVKLQLSGDKSVCKVFVSDLQGAEKTKEAVEGLKRANGHIRREIGSRLRLRVTPEFRFFADDSIEKSAEISKILRGASEPEKSNFSSGE